MTELDEPMVVPSTLEGERLDRAVALITGWSRTTVSQLIEDGNVLVGGVAVGRSRRLVAGDVVELLAGPAPQELPGAEPVPLEIRHVDDDLIVIAKPAGLVVHPGAGHAHGTLVHGLLERFPEIATVGDPTRPGIVHRLDRDTSGLLLVARTADAYTALVDALAARTIRRDYQALVWGIPEAPRGVIDAPIGRSARQRTRMAVRTSGREARTTYEVRSSWNQPLVTMLACRLETGRTHQVRVHLSAIGHPVVGDVPYGGHRSGVSLGRPFLHAAALGLDHPITAEPLHFEEPLPVELATVIADLGPAAGATS